MIDICYLQNSIEALIDCQRLDDAKRELARAYRHYPDVLELKFLEAKIASEQEEHHVALTLLMEVLKIDPNNVEYRHFYFHTCFELDFYAQAENIIIELLKDYPEEASFYSAYALLMLETRHSEKAQKLAKEALRLDPDNIYARLIDAYGECVVGNSQVGEALLSDLLGEDPDNDAIAYMLLLPLSENGKENLALRLAQELLSRNPKDQDIIEIIIELKIALYPLFRPYSFFARQGFLPAALAWGIFVITIFGLISFGFVTLGLIIAGFYAFFVWLGRFIQNLMKYAYKKGLIND